MDERPVVLVGMMGVGKSAVGRVLALRLARPFVDGDEELEASTGRPIPQIFAADGEDTFRRLESEVLARVLDRRPPVVLSAGGGVVVLEGNRQRLRRDAVVVWLRAPVAELAQRVGAGRGRPLLAGGDPAVALARLSEERAPWYAEVADVVVDTDHRRPEALAELVEGELSAVAAGGRP